MSVLRYSSNPVKRSWNLTITSLLTMIFVFMVFTQHSLVPQELYNGEIFRLFSSIRNQNTDCSEDGFSDATIHHYHPESNATNFCKSKHEQHCFRKHRTGKYLPPPAFLNVVREYEHFHQRCTHGHNLTKLLIEGTTAKDCKYLVWKEKDGLGNQIVSITSAYIYALLTRRALLISWNSNVKKLFCEPFPYSSWLTPEGFQGEKVRLESKRIGVYFREILKLKIENSSLLSALEISQSMPGAPKHLDILITCCDFADHQFFCPTAQKLLANIPWLFFYSHEYSIPGFYFIPQFRETLNDWFPDKSIFMHTARYLFNPHNRLWNRIKHQYQSYFGGADRQVGIQARAWNSEYHPVVNKQVLYCGIDSGLLPRPLLATNDEQLQQAMDRARSKKPHAGKLAVLMASLRPEYYYSLSDTYSNNPDPNGGAVSIYNPSQEGAQRTGNLGHDEKAVVDIWLLSFMDDIMITHSSSFGTVSSGLSGIVPIVFNRYGQDKTKLPEPICERSNLAGPCFIRYPERLPCDLDPPVSGLFDAGYMIPEIKHCWLNSGIGVYQV